MDLSAELPTLLPLAIAWARDQEAAGLRDGEKLSPPGMQLARSVGVVHPEQVRVVVTDVLPYPEHPALRQAAAELGMLGPDTAGLTLGYAVFILQVQTGTRLLSHELRHGHQYENNGSIEGFLPLYLRQVIDCGYPDAPLERDAREHEVLQP